MKATQRYINSLEFRTMPRDEGQIVEVSYACDEDGVWCQIYDRSDGSVVHEFAKYYAKASEAQLKFEPWNGSLPRHNKMKRVKVTA